jgi:signal transduction histidine kinase
MLIKPWRKKQEPLLEISLIQSSDRWNLLIKDSGEGMKKETLKRLFEPFYTTKSKGTGLGLAVAYKIFESHQALVFVRSELGQGTEFEFNFPCLGS